MHNILLPVTSKQAKRNTKCPVHMCSDWNEIPALVGLMRALMKALMKAQAMNLKCEKKKFFLSSLFGWKLEIGNNIILVR